MARLGPLILLILLACPGAAHASPTSDLAGFLDGDSAVAMRVDLDQLEEAIELYRTSGMAGATETVFMASAASAALLGFDPMTRNGWLAAGFDPATPILAGLAAIDEVIVDHIYRGPRDPTAQTYWRARIVMSMSDRTRARASLRKLAKLVPDIHPVAAAAATDLARTLGAKANRSQALVAALDRAGVVCAGRIAAIDQLVFAHIAGDVAIIDIVGGFATSLRWSRDREALLALLARRPAGKSLARRLGNGAARRLSEPGIVLWVDPNRLLVAREALRRDQILRAGHTRELQPQLCAQFGEIAAHGPFADLALVTRISPRTRTAKPRIETSLAWGLRRAYRLAAAFLARSDGLIDAHAAVASHGATIAGGLYLRSLDPLRALPRPQLVDRGRTDLVLAMDRCGGAATTVLLLFGWPQLLASRVDAIASVHAEAATLVGSVRNSVFAIDRVGLDLATIAAGFAVSFAAKADGLVDGYLTHVFGASREESRAGRKLTSWGHGRIRPYATRSAALRIYGAAVDPSALAWFLGLPAGKKTRPGIIAELVADPRAVMTDLAKGHGRAAAAARQLLPSSKLAELFESSLAVDGDQLTATSIWRLR